MPPPCPRISLHEDLPARPRISATHVMTSVAASPPAQPHCAPPRWDHPSAPPLRDGIREQQGHRDGIWEEASGPPPSSATSSYVPLHPLRTLPITITRPSGPAAPVTGGSAPPPPPPLPGHGSPGPSLCFTRLFFYKFRSTSILT